MQRSDLLSIFVLGSRLWKTHRPSSDWDLMIVLKDSAKAAPRGGITSVHSGNGKIDATLITLSEYRDRCRRHEWLVLLTRWLPRECVLLGPGDGVSSDSSLALKRELLAATVGRETARDWKRARKYIERGDLARGKRTLGHTLRMNVLAEQLARCGAVADFSAANHLVEELRDVYEPRWAWYEERFGGELRALQAALRAPAEVEAKAEAGQSLIRTRSAEERRRAAAARQDASQEEAVHRALSAELSAVQQELSAMSTPTSKRGGRQQPAVRRGVASRESRSAAGGQRGPRRTDRPKRFYCVMDFEATCDDQGPWVNEIIEFPAVLLDATTLQPTGDEFRAMVRPTERPILTPFCTQLTSIEQHEVGEAEELGAVLQRFDRWLRAVVEEAGGVAGSQDEVLPVTCGDWDLGKQLPAECGRKGLTIPSVLGWWCNIKRPFCLAMNCTKAKGMGGMLRTLNLSLVGHHHLGIDDSRNIARITTTLGSSPYEQPIVATGHKKEPPRAPPPLPAVLPRVRQLVALLDQIEQLKQEQEQGRGRVVAAGAAVAAALSQSITAEEAEEQARHSLAQLGFGTVAPRLEVLITDAIAEGGVINRKAGEGMLQGLLKSIEAGKRTEAACLELARARLLQMQKKHGAEKLNQPGRQTRPAEQPEPEPEPEPEPSQLEPRKETADMLGDSGNEDSGHHRDAIVAYMREHRPGMYDLDSCDERGAPTRLADGKEPSKQQKKKIAKALQAATKAVTKEAAAAAAAAATATAATAAVAPAGSKGPVALITHASMNPVHLGHIDAPRQGSTGGPGLQSCPRRDCDHRRPLDPQEGGRTDRKCRALAPDRARQRG